MENLYLSFNVVMPVCLTMILGYFLKKIHVFDSSSLKKINSAVFKVFLPILIFYNIYTSEIADIFNFKLILYSILSILAVFLLAFIFVIIIEKDNKKRGVLIQGIFRSNFVILGIPFSTALYGNEINGTISVLIAIIVPLFNILAVICLEIFHNAKPDFKTIIKGIITNPLIIASSIGLIFLFAKIKLFSFIEPAMVDIKNMTTPLAIIALGGAIDFKSVKKNIKQIIIGILGKLVFTPLIVVGFGILAGFRNAELMILVTLSASPVAVSSYTMAQQMGGDDELAAQLQMFTTTLCIITVFLWVFVLKQFAFI